MCFRTVIHHPDGRVCYANLDCNNWDCEECRPKLISRWISHIKAIFAGKTIHRLTVSKKSWQSLRRRIKRAGGNHATIRNDDGTVSVYATVPFNAEDRDSIETSPEDAVALASHNLNQTSINTRPIRTSNGWYKRSVKKETEWSRVPGKFEREDVVNAAKQCGGATAEKMGRLIVSLDPDTGIAVFIDALRQCRSRRTTGTNPRRYFDDQSYGGNYHQMMEQLAKHDHSCV